MQTAWQGLAVSPLADNTLDSLTALTPFSTPVTLTGTPAPNLDTVVTLPTGTTLVRLWNATDIIYVAFDTTPGPIPATPPATPQIPAAAFMPGAILIPGEVLALAVPNPTVTHTLNLISRGASTTVQLTAFTE